MIRVVKMGATGPNRTKMRGMGDVVYKFAHPIAKRIDAIAGTNLANCGGCEKRRNKLNEAIPFKGGKD